MRDFRAGGDINVGGDVHIIDNSYQPKLLAMCTIDELLEERRHRARLLEQERGAKWKRLVIGWAFLAAVGGALSLYFYFQGDTNLSSLVLGLGGLAGAFGSMKVLEQPTEFEARQIAALNEIAMLLRERGLG